MASLVGNIEAGYTIDEIDDATSDEDEVAANGVVEAKAPNLDYFDHAEFCYQTKEVSLNQKKSSIEKLESQTA